MSYLSKHQRRTSGTVAQDDEKVCRVCRQTSPPEGFYGYTVDGKGYTSKVCKGCYRLQQRERADRRRESRNGKPRPIRKSTQGMTMRGRIAHYANMKAESGCTDCGWNGDWRELHFDHLPGHVKLFDISYGVRRVSEYSDEEVAAEVAKCEVVCFDCHVRRTKSRLAPHDRPGWIYTKTPRSDRHPSEALGAVDGADGAQEGEGR